MIDTLQLVKEFHVMVNHPVEKSPCIANLAVNTLRIAFLQDELDELIFALARKDEVGVLDALTDLQYVLDGAYLSFGFHRVKEEAFTEVHLANMSKTGGQLREDGKAMKGPNYKAPDLRKIVDKLKGVK